MSDDPNTLNDEVNCILLSPHGRSGSVFFHSLLDGHPQIASFPSIEMAYNFPRIITDIPTALESFIKNNPHVFDSSKGYLGGVEKNVAALFGPNQNEHLHIDAEEFKNIALCNVFNEAIRAVQHILRKDFVVGLYKAYARITGQEPENIKYILFHAHSYELDCHNKILYDFPDVYYVAMLRDPRENWYSWDKVCKLRHGDRYDKHLKLFMRNSNIKSYFDAVHSLYDLSLKLKPGHLKLIDLNKLHKLNSNSMFLMSKYLDIDPMSHYLAVPS